VSLDSLAGAQDLEQQRAAVKRARREGYHWLFRAVLLTIISGLSFSRHWIIFGVLFAALALMSVQLARVTQRVARVLVARIKELEAK
jgi:hypothetical protein